MSNMFSGFQVHAEKTHFGREFALWFHRMRQSGDGELREVVQPVTMVISVGPPGMGEPIDPSLTLDHRFAQNLMDALWESGLRPNNGESSDAQVTALKTHLTDMRDVAFGLLKQHGVEHKA